MKGLDPRLREILVCPRCKGRLEEKEDSLICKRCKLAYPIKDGIPVMLISEAKKIEE
ncbi:Trm112 family protein [candidate division WOR-3 bacterium]|uniref:UPF0434 protein DRP53_03175 n=1 Tax=candidate division WOR-3 bacterium TaxID=2052148 RepID=A0A660SJK8_UNCW3|nr:MAG: Trm112 family protein [candidate division WOR-3 bacterium]